MVPQLIGIFILIALILWVDPQSSSRMIYYAIPLATLAIYGIYAQSYTHRGWMYVAMFTFFVVSVITVFFTVYMSNSEMIQSLIYLLSPLFYPAFILLGMAAGAPYITRWANRQTGIIGFLVNGIMFLPCALRSGVQYIFNEFQITTSATWSLLAIQTGLALLYFSGPAWLQTIRKWVYGDFILRETFLFGTPDFPKAKYIGDATYFKDHPKTNYTVAFWVYQNEDRNSGPAHTILNYGERPHARVYQNELMISHGGGNPVNKNKIFIPLQKWVYVVCVYTKNVCNIFIDGEFVATDELGGTAFTFTPVIAIGDERVYGNGGMRMVRTSMKPLSKTRIQTDYLYQKRL